ncbi:hypothetical protein LLG96_13280 [bacterium]|nr:hypothetical protein [bacterium]
MEDLWGQIKKSVMDGVNIAAEKTEELTKLGKVKLDILNLKYKISRKFTELGGITYEAVKKDDVSKTLKSEKTVALIEAIKKLESDLEAKEKRYQDMMKKAKDEKKAKKEKKEKKSE